MMSFMLVDVVIPQVYEICFTWNNFGGKMLENEFLQLIGQSGSPANVVADTLQLYYVDGDVFVKLHDGGDPGQDLTYKIVDWDFGVVPWSKKTIEDGTQTILPNATLITCVPTENTQINSSGGYDGHIQIYQIDNTAGVEITFNTGFTGVTSILATDTGIQLRMVYYDGATWRPITLGAGSDNVGGVYPFAAGKAFLFCFKMVNVTEFATPETGRTPAVTISKNSGAFAGLTGAPAVSEISNGWYSVTVPAVDMVSGVVVLKAIATGCAQEDFVIYMA